MGFDAAIERVLGHEGGYSQHPDDPGRETMWGITSRVAVAEGYLGPMQALPLAKAKEIYRKRYWTPLRGDDLPEWMQFHALDAAVHSGVSQAVKWLQRALGVLDDGVMGPVTIAAAQKSDKAMLTRFYGQRLDLMTSLPTWSAFGRGWARRVAANLMEA